MGHKTIEELFNDDKYKHVVSAYNLEDRDRLLTLNHSDAVFKLNELVNNIENASRMVMP